MAYEDIDDELDDDADDDDEVADEQAGAMTPGEAQAKMEELIATPGFVAGELKFNNPAAYRRIVKEVAALSAIAARKDEEKDVEAVRDFEAAQSKKQNDLVAQAEKEMAALQALGFEPAEIPDDVQPYHLHGLQQQRLLAEGKFEEVAPMLEQDLRDLRAPSDVARAFSIFINARDVDADVRDKITDEVIRWVYRANEQKRSKK